MTCSPAHCTHEGSFLGPCDASRRLSSVVSALWVPERACWLSWAQLARYQISIYQYSAQVDKILKYFQASWQIASASNFRAIPSDLAF